MTKIKLFYKHKPAYNNLETDDLEISSIWQFNKMTSIHNILDTCGLDYEWTDKEEEGIVFLDFGSRNIKDLEPFIEKYGNIYKKCVVFSSQEPLFVQDKDYDILEKYPNVIISDNMIPIYDNTHERHCSIHYFASRHVNNELNEITIYPWQNFEKKDRRYRFNNLKSRWTPDKFLMQYLLEQNNLIKNNLVTYRPPANLTEDNIRKVKEMLRKGEDLSFLDYLKECKESQIENDKLEIVGIDGRRTPVVRYHPPEVYNECYFSLISENVNSADFVWLSDKTLYPILNGHPFIVFGNHGLHIELEAIGFRLFENIFNYDFDTEYLPLVRAEDIINQCKEFNRKEYVSMHKEILEISLHNRKNFANTNSRLWQVVRKQVERLIEKYNDL